MTKIFYLNDRILESNRNFTTEHVKIVKFQVFQGFQVKWQPFSTGFRKNIKISLIFIKLLN